MNRLYSVKFVTVMENFQVIVFTYLYIIIGIVQYYMHLLVD